MLRIGDGESNLRTTRPSRARRRGPIPGSARPILQTTPCTISQVGRTYHFFEKKSGIARRPSASGGRLAFVHHPVANSLRRVRRRHGFGGPHLVGPRPGPPVSTQTRATRRRFLQKSEFKLNLSRYFQIIILYYYLLSFFRRCNTVALDLPLDHRLCRLTTFVGSSFGLGGMMISVSLYTPVVGFMPGVPT